MAVTHIGTPASDTQRLRFQGKDTLAELVGQYTFTEAIYLAATRRKPDPIQTRLLDACLVLLMDHGITPSALVARLVADSLPGQAQAAIAAGLLTVGDRFIGTMAGAGEILASRAQGEVGIEDWARQTVARYLAARQRIPGFGHPAYTPDDPRTLALFSIAAATGISGSHIKAIRAIESEIAEQSGRRLTLNATGAIAAVLTEIGFPVAAMRSLAVVSRSAGLLAHVLEESQTHGVEEVSSYAQTAFVYSD